MCVCVYERIRTISTTYWYIYIYSIGPKKLKRYVWQKEMNSQKRNTRNLNLRKKIVVAFILGDYSGLLLKSSFNSVLPRLFFLVSLSNVFFLCHSFSPCTSARVRRKGSPSSSWRWRQRCYRRPVDTYAYQSDCYDRLSYDMGRAACASVETCLKPVLNYQNLATWFSYITIWWKQFGGSRRFDGHQWNSSATHESSRVIILKSRFFSTGHSAWTSEIRDIFDRQTFVPNDWWQLMCSNAL